MALEMPAHAFKTHYVQIKRRCVMYDANNQNNFKTHYVQIKLRPNTDMSASDFL